MAFQDTTGRYEDHLEGVHTKNTTSRPTGSENTDEILTSNHNTGGLQNHCFVKKQPSDTRSGYRRRAEGPQ